MRLLTKLVPLFLAGNLHYSTDLSAMTEKTLPHSIQGKAAKVNSHNRNKAFVVASLLGSFGLATGFAQPFSPQTQFGKSLANSNHAALMGAAEDMPGQIEHTFGELQQGLELADMNLDHIDTALSQLGISSDRATNPEVISDLLKDMDLYDFQPSSKAFSDFLEKAKTSPQPLKPLITAIKAGIEENPAINELVAYLVENKMLSKPSELENLVHQIYLMEAFTIEMANSYTFTQEIQDFIVKQRESYGITPHHDFSTFFQVWHSTGDVFLAMKAISVDPAITSLRYHGKEGDELTIQMVNKLFKEKKISLIEKKILLKSLDEKTAQDQGPVGINIYEASVTDAVNGFKDNAFVGHVLVKMLESNDIDHEMSVDKVIPSLPASEYLDLLDGEENTYTKTFHSDDWVKLYIAWNLVFVFDNLEDLQVIAPKLLIPSVLSAKPENFMQTRIPSLWLTLHHVVTRSLKGEDKVATTKKKKQIAEALGRINKKYALKIINESENLDLKEIEKTYQQFFRFPYLNLMKYSAGVMLK